MLSFAIFKNKNVKKPIINRITRRLLYIFCKYWIKIGRKLSATEEEKIVWMRLRCERVHKSYRYNISSVDRLAEQLKAVAKNTQHPNQIIIFKKKRIEWTRKEMKNNLAFIPIHMVLNAIINKLYSSMYVSPFHINVNHACSLMWYIAAALQSDTVRNVREIMSSLI